MESRDATLLVRKLRKKLRQIENLEALDRELTDEELSKCMKKDSIRENLLDLLAEYNLNNSATSHPSLDQDSSFTWTDLSTSVSVSETDVNLQFTPIPVDENPIRQNQQEREFELETKQAKADGKETETISSIPIKQQQKPERAIIPDVGERQKSGPAKEELKQPSPTKKSKKPNKGKSGGVSDQWRESGFSVTVLESHNDLVTAVDCYGSTLVSASRDTTVKIWDLTTLTEVRSLGSHTGAVTDVVVVPKSMLPDVGEGVSVAEDDMLVFSGSVDCSLKVWSAKTGELLKSIYTYNPISKLAFCKNQALVVTASDGGKLELWDIAHKENVCSVSAHPDAISALCVDDNRICTASGKEGEIKLYEIRDRVLHCIYAAENIRSLTGATLSLRYIRALGIKGDNLYYGDDGVNVKILAWKKGIVKKIANHKEEFGITDAICYHSSTMLTSAYDLDTGQGYINVFDVSGEPSYMTSVVAEDTRRILDMCCGQSDTGVTIVTAGLDLQVWTQCTASGTSEDIIPTTYIPSLTQFAQDSDLESDFEFTEDSDSEAEGGGRNSRRGSHQSQGQSGWGSWCTVL